MKRDRKQKGVFIVELAIILVFISALIAMQVNVMLATSKKGQMDRLAYSLVTMLAERKEFFDDDFKDRTPKGMCNGQGDCSALADDFYDIAVKSMDRMATNFDQADFGIQIEEYIKSESENKYRFGRRGATAGCNFKTIKEVDEIIPKTVKGDYLPIYQVSLCYQTSFNVIGIDDGQFSHVVSSAFNYARY